MSVLGRLPPNWPMQFPLPFDRLLSEHLPVSPEASGGTGDEGHAAAGQTLRQSPSSTEVVFVRHPRARRYILRVLADGVVRVTIPRGGSKREGRAFADRQQVWVAEQVARLARDRAAHPERSPALSEAEIRTRRRRAREELVPRLHELASAHGLRVARVSVRNQRGRWGSCSTSGHISLNWRLMEMPDWVRDYVLIHELMHLKRSDHSPVFWRLVAGAFPRYREARAWLRALSEGPEERDSER